MNPTQKLAGHLTRLIENPLPFDREAVAREAERIMVDIFVGVTDAALAVGNLETPILAAARSDAEFDGRDWDTFGRINRERYIARATLAHAAGVRAAYERAAKEISCACLYEQECRHPHACCREDVAAIIALIDKT